MTQLMKFDFESLTAEPLIYMLMHSAVFVCVLGFIFFVVGLLFGYATWGRYKRQTRLLQKEAEAMKGEIADLKRKIADHTVKSGPVIAMATETIHMPKREESAAPAPAAVPAAAAPPPVAVHAEAPPPAKLNLIRPKAPVQKPQETPPAPVADEPVSALTSSTESLSPNPWVTSQPSERPSSPLAAIIATHPHAHHVEAGVEAGGAVADAIAIPSELSVAPLPEIDLQPEPAVIKPELKIKAEPEIKPEADPRLGLIYKSRPEKVDDLTALNGIAQVLQQRLNECGVYTYAQIASWNEENIREFSSRLAFKDRIQREHWVEQAAKLAAGGKKAA